MEPANKKSYGNDETFSEMERLDSIHTGSGKFSSKEDLDVLKAYFKEMGEVPQMTAAQEAETWKKIDICLQNARNVLYKFGFIFKEHIRILSDPEIDDLSDIFPVDPNNPLQNFTLDETKRKEWMDEITLVYEKMILQFSKKKSSKKLNDLKTSGIDTLMKHPALPVQLLEWHDVALRYQQLYKEGSISDADLEEKTL